MQQCQQRQVRETARLELRRYINIPDFRPLGTARRVFRARRIVALRTYITDAARSIAGVTKVFYRRFKDGEIFEHTVWGEMAR
jgi:hypothetical protein